MAYYLGIDLGTTYTAAAAEHSGVVEALTLGNRTASVPSVVFLRADGEILVGEAATRRATTDPGRVAREFKRRLGDPTPIILGGTPYGAEMLMARLLRWSVDRVQEQQGEPPRAIALTHPANWGPYKLDLLSQAVRQVDLDAALFLAEPVAAATFYASQRRLEPGDTVAVYDLGGGTFDAAMVRRTAVGFDIIGSPEGIERLGGIDFDEAVYAHVQGAVGEGLADLDPEEPAAQAAVARLRQECIDAKEALSSDTDVSIPVLLPGVQTEVRLTRAEFESMIRPAINETIVALRRAIRSAGVSPDEISAVLLVGGSSRIPLVAQMVGAELGRPIAIDAHPKDAIAFGAAIAVAGHRGSATPESVTTVLPDATRPPPPTMAPGASRPRRTPDARPAPPTRTPDPRPPAPTTRPPAPAAPAAPTARPGAPAGQPAGPAGRPGAPTARPGAPTARPGAQPGAPTGQGPAARPAAPVGAAAGATGGAQPGARAGRSSPAPSGAAASTTPSAKAPPTSQGAPSPSPGTPGQRPPPPDASRPDPPTTTPPTPTTPAPTPPATAPPPTARQQATPPPPQRGAPRAAPPAASPPAGPVQPGARQPGSPAGARQSPATPPPGAGRPGTPTGPPPVRPQPTAPGALPTPERGTRPPTPLEGTPGAAAGSPLGTVSSGGRVPSGPTPPVPVPAGAGGGNRNVWIAVAAAAAVIVVAVGAVILLGGGGGGDNAGTTTTTQAAGYGPQLEDEFLKSCDANGASEDVCQCAYDKFEATVPFSRFVEIDREIDRDPSARPKELLDILDECVSSSSS